MADAFPSGPADVNRAAAVIFLDFDGVICDSLAETLVSSWIAYHALLKNNEPASMPAGFMKQFSRLRPFVRSGEDYVLLQELLERGVPISTQADFDRQIAEAGRERMGRLKEMFYRARQDLLARHRDFWLTLNPVFPALADALRRRSGDPRIFILSTKRRAFILEILRANRIDFPEDHVIDSGRESKADVIGRVLDDTGAERAIFIDDQIDHLAGVTDRRIGLCLAAWGYVKPEWLARHDSIRVLKLEEAVRLVLEF